LNSLADFIGAHAAFALLVCIALAALGTWLALTVVQRLAAVEWRAMMRLWHGVADSSHGRRVPEASWASRFDARRFLSLHTLVCIAIAAIALSVFAELAEEIRASEEVVAFDERLASSLRAHTDANTLRFFALITKLGDRTSTIALGAAVLLVFCVRRWWWHAAVWALATGGGGLLLSWLKNVFERARPLHDHALTDTVSWSFPSGHAAGAVFVYGMLGYMLARHTPRRWRVPIALATVTLITVVGFSRVILHVHFLSDVIAGFAVASAWIALWVAAFEVLQRHPEREPQRAAAIETSAGS
jgi:membrane-associated phospholipid phosphatase